MAGFSRRAQLPPFLALLLLSLGTVGLLSLTASVLEVDLTVLQSATKRGAVCLDGSPPAYHFSGGFGSGESSWLVHIEGGGWCHNVTNCLSRMKGKLGSSRAMGAVRFSGILNDHGELNPYFYNWNKVKVGYCDGSSFTGDVDRVDPVSTNPPARPHLSRTNPPSLSLRILLSLSLSISLSFSFSAIFDAVMEDLLAKGMKNATNALLSGCSAGGLTSVLHCDRFRALLPADARVKCLTDGGYFVNAKDISGIEYVRAYFNSIVETHGSAKNLPPSCTLRMSPGMCFFPQYVAPRILTPLFILNAAYDSWQIRNILVPLPSDREGTWKDCRADITKCNTKQIEGMQVFRQEFLKDLGRTIASDPSNGFFINSCFAHCQTELTTVAEAVGLWFYDLRDFKEIDCPYPCDSSCYNNKYESQDGLEDNDIHKAISATLVRFRSQSRTYNERRE
ncbi:unnamed protein product [Spirodela intermedia]|uniref:Pectin acetylesterase n=1 Tax=Spirodela intermedia TaxID=51605 RepID=A0A7I8JCH0_SPIIN|nr:unnamed protein product [Spirodela intermedia]CAA6667092.1 unnamed protein product [Spirodela intermedia]